MTINLTTLTKRILNKFVGRAGPIDGKIAPPSDIKVEVKALQDLAPGEHWTVPSGVRAFDFFYNGTYCVAITYHLTDEERDEIAVASGGTVTPIDVLGSVYLYLVDELKLRAKLVDPLEVEEFIGGPAGSPQGVDLAVLKSHLEEIAIFSLNDNSIFDKSVSNKYVGSYLATFDAGFKINNALSKKAIEQIRELFREQKDYLLEPNFFEAMSTPVLKHAFLEIYRALEFVFVLPRAIALQSSLNSAGATIQMNVLDFARHCYKELGWKRVERDSILRLFKSYASTNYLAFLDLAANCRPFSQLKKVQHSESEEDKLGFISKIASTYYDLRNQIAHQFWEDEMIQCDDADFQKLIEFTLGCISYIYEEHLSK